jgi:hypothetical protein
VSASNSTPINGEHSVVALSAAPLHLLQLLDAVSQTRTSEEQEEFPDAKD